MTEKNSCFAAHGSMSRRDGRDGDRRRNCLELSGRKTLRATADRNLTRRVPRSSERRQAATENSVFLTTNRRTRAE